MNRPTLVLVCFLCSFATVAGAQEWKISVNDLIDETQRVSDDPDRLGLVWWLPDAFWEASMSEGDAPSTPEQIEDFLKIFEGYTVFAVADGAIGALGGVSWASPEETRAAAVLHGSDGTRYTPIATDDVSPDAVNLAAMMGPVLEGMLGPMGENMEFLFFPSTGADGEPIADPVAEGTFSFQLGEDMYD